jgi:hypothetical protein
MERRFVIGLVRRRQNCDRSCDKGQGNIDAAGEQGLIDRLIRRNVDMSGRLWQSTQSMVTGDGDLIFVQG